MSRPYHWTTFRGIRGTTPVETIEGLTWSGVVAALSRFDECPDVETRAREALLFGAYRLRGSRADHNAADLCLAVFDYDAGTEADVVATRGRLQADGVSQHWYTSFNYGVDGKVAWRLVIPLSEPVGAAAWRYLRRDLVARYSLKVEVSKCEGYSHFYYLPVTRPGQKGATFSLEGRPIDTSVIAAAYPPGALTPAALYEAPSGDVAENLDELREALRTRALAHRLSGAVDKSLILERISEGVDLRDGTVVTSESGDPPMARAAALLVNAVPEQSFATYEALLRPTFEATSANGAKLRWGKVQRMLRSAVAKRDTYKPLTDSMAAMAQEWM